MKTVLFLITLTLIVLANVSLAQDTTSTYFIVLYTTGDNWDPEKEFYEQQYAEEHSKHLSDLRKSKTVSIGGRYSDTGLLLIKATDEAAAKELITTDSAVLNGIFNAEIHPFDAFYSGCVD